MSFRVDSNVCDPMIASCQNADGQEVISECLDSSDSSLSLSDNYSLDNGLETAAIVYSNRVINNVVGTVDGVRHLVENECASGVREGTGMGYEDGFIPQTLIVGCSIGGMIVGTVKGVVSLPGRVVDFGRRLFSGAAESVGEALADLNFFAIEFAGYGQMGVGAVQALRGGVPLSAPVSGNNIGGFSGGGAVVVSRPAFIPALAAVGDICVASGEAAVGVAAASGDDFGGPLAAPRPVFNNGGDEIPPPDSLAVPRKRVVEEFSKLGGREFSWQEIERMFRRLIANRGFTRIGSDPKTQIHILTLEVGKKTLFGRMRYVNVGREWDAATNFQVELKSYKGLDHATGKVVPKTELRVAGFLREEKMPTVRELESVPVDDLEEGSSFIERGVDKAADFRADVDQAMRRSIENRKF